LGSADTTARAAKHSRYPGSAAEVAAREGAEADDNRRAGIAGSTGLGGDTSATVGILMATEDDDCGN
jgi:hypothetical protein